LEALAAGSLGLGLLNYGESAAAKKAANRQNAFANKWGPLLSVNGGKGAAQVSAPSANFGQSMVPALLTAGMLMQNKKPGGMHLDSTGGLAGAGDDMNMDTMYASQGGQVPASKNYAPSRPWAENAYSSSYENPYPDTYGNRENQRREVVPYELHKLLTEKKRPAGPAYSSGGSIGGGMIPGKQVVPGNSPLNDNHLVMASAGETVLPKDVSKAGMHGNMWKVADYLGKVKQHGPGPMPMKPQQKKPASMSPWSAMAAGGQMKGC
jgi:hypothetical protein